MLRISVFLVSFLLFSAQVFAGEQRLVFENGGNDLVGIMTKPEQTGKSKIPLVILMHGLGANKDYFLLSSLAQAFDANGVATLRFDFDGHGESGGRDVDMTVPKELSDARIFIQYALQQKWVSAVTLLGHSQGGLVAGLLAAEFGAGLIPNLVQLAPAGCLIDLPQTGAVGQYALFNPKNPPETFMFGNFNIGRKYLETLADLPPVYDTARRYKGKVLLLQGDADVLVPFQYSEKYDKAYSECHFKLLEGENHSFSVYFQQVLHDVVRFVIQNS